MKFLLALCAFALFAAFSIHAEADKAPICEPKSVFMDDCNQCRCSDDGLEKSCTRIMCVVKPEGEVARTRRDLTEETCEPGSRFNISCNECICPDSGMKSLAQCTLMACEDDIIGGTAGNPTKRAARQISNRCTPGSMFKIDCNECICPSSGMRDRAACTLKACF